MMRSYPVHKLVVRTCGVLAAAALWYFLAPPSTAQQPATSDPVGNQELAQMFAEDQSDRMPPDGAPIDWSAVGPRDRAREERTKELYRENQLHTGADYYHAAMILQHGASPEDYLLAHELCVVAIDLGEPSARWLAAASEDRFLMSIGRPQRFGTQYLSDDAGHMRLYRVDDSVTDSLRAAMEVPSIAEARVQETAGNSD